MTGKDDPTIVLAGRKIILKGVVTTPSSVDER